MGEWSLHCSMQAFSSCRTWALECAGFSGHNTPASVIVAHGLSCPAAHGILGVWSGIEPPPPALKGGFLTTRPPGKSQNSVLSYWPWKHWWGSLRGLYFSRIHCEHEKHFLFKRIYNRDIERQLLKLKFWFHLNLKPLTSHSACRS